MAEDDRVLKPDSQYKLQQDIRPRMIECPGCSVQISLDQLDAQSDHMEKVHPEIADIRFRGPML